MPDDLQFSDAEQLSKEQRAGMLFGAAREAIALSHLQGAGDAAKDNQDAEMFQAFAKDEAKFSRPLVFSVDVKDALAGGKLPIPVDLQQVAARSSFFLLHFPFELEPAGSYSFHRFKMRVEFNFGADAVRPKVHAIFPANKFKEILKANAGIHVSVEPNLQFSATTGPLKAQMGPAAVSATAGVAAAAKLTGGFDLPPIEFNWKRSLVTTSSTGLEWAWWDVAGAEIARGDDLHLMAIVEVPKQLARVVVAGRITASRHYDLIRRLFRHLNNLTKPYREFVEAGLPCGSELVEFDLSEEMTRAH